MAQSLKVIKTRVRSIQSTEKVTSAMQMIAVTKLSRIERQLTAMRPYFKKLESLFCHLTQYEHNATLLNSPFFKQNEKKEKILLCVFTSDTGLCGAYNNNIIRQAEEFIYRQGKEKVKLVVIGKRGFKYFNSRGFNIINSYIGLNAKYSDKVCDEITKALSSIFLAQEADEIYLAYTHFETALILRPTIIKFLNLEIEPTEGIDYIFEPGRERILEEMLPKYISFKMRSIFLEAFTSEHAARTVAMRAATENARELLHWLILLRNKVRQANITRDILEIISSAEALKG
ncbi:MAG: ATP synthase F1 subunit gamma [Candidatus Omnitrophica bacterium]|nr:ATP synthase F1 subunit gamma [Candidatus Omnitrophota bacterium]